ncbi:MAG: dihydroorotase, partial [Boseongicola sp.]|nr:dihydroorotase [Boseongicola sp.]
NDMLVGGMRPHLYCLPILKRGTHRPRLVEAATSGNPRFFLGTDSAPHPVDRKEAECCAAGCFTAPVALSCLAEVFDAAGALDRLEAFTSLNGPAFYGLPVNEETITLEKGDPIDTPASVETGAGSVTVFDPGRALHWRVT